MNPGRRREIVHFYYADTSVGSDDWGQPDADVYPSTPSETRHAKVEAAQGSSQKDGESEHARMRTTITVRRKGLTITEQTRVEWRGTMFDVETWQPVGDRREDFRIEAVRDE